VSADDRWEEGAIGHATRATTHLLLGGEGRDGGNSESSDESEHVDWKGVEVIKERERGGYETRVLEKRVFVESCRLKE
jgi:hypothetical protein